MLKGDLVTTPLPSVLRQLADSASSGCLHVLDARGEEGRVYLRGGLVYAVQVAGERPLLGQHLVSSGALGPEMLAEAQEAQRTELQGWKLGELLVHLGYVDAPVVEEFLAEQMRDQAGDLLRWPTGTWKFRVNERAREDVARPTSVEELLGDCDARAAQWDTLLEVLHGQEAVPVLSAAGATDSEMAIDPQAWSLLCKVDGVRSIADLAKECGFTLFEAGRVVHTLVLSGLLEIEEPLVLEDEEPVGASVASRLAAAFAPAEGHSAVIPQQPDEPSAADVAGLLSSALREDRSAAALLPPPVEEVDGSIDRISAALSAMLGPTTDDTLFAPRPRKESKPKPNAAEKDKAERDRRRRERDAAELAAAQAELESARRAAWEGPFADDHEAEIVSLADVRREAARRDEDQARAVQDEARALEQDQLTEQARSLEQEQAALVADRAQLEMDSRAVEEDRLRRAEEGRLAEAARKAEAERLAEQAREEQARRQEQARLVEEERLRAAEETRLAEARARLDQEKADLAAERARLDEQVRQAQEEAEQARLAAEAEAERLAEELRLAEQARLEAEAEAARAAAQAEAEAAEQARLEQEQEQARLESEAAEQARLEQEQEQARLESEEAAARALVEAQLREEAAAQAEAQARADAEAREHAAEAQLREAVEAQARADAELVEQARAATLRSEASSAFAELSAAAAIVSEPEAQELPAVPDEPLEEPDEAPLHVGNNDDTDMASLFRELSSLGMDDEPAPAPPPRTPPRPTATPGAQQKKKKGLFGR